MLNVEANSHILIDCLRQQFDLVEVRMLLDKSWSLVYENIGKSRERSKRCFKILIGKELKIIFLTFE